ncbi:MAG: type II secretion system protein M [Deltaproteobacteria bacterium]|nr:type II secretion system protein M [Deltaproteobacteria bacterium]
MKLARREKLFIGGAGLILVGFLIITQLVVPFFNRKDRLEKEAKELEQVIQEYVQAGAGGQDIESISGNLEKVLAARGDEPLDSFINKEASAIGITKKIPRMRPSEGKKQGDFLEDIVELPLEAVSLAQLTEFLYRIEKPEKFIYISRITIKDNKKEEGFLDATIRVLTYKRI